MLLALMMGQMLRNFLSGRRQIRLVESDGDDLNPLVCRVGGNSFPTGTQIRMASGRLTPIEHIDPGDRVLAADPVSGVWSSQLVLDQWSHIDDGHMVTALLADGSQITATDHHLFWVASDGAWLELEDIAAGDLLLTPTGVTAVAAVVVHPVAETLVWELDTAGPDTFTVNAGRTYSSTTPTIRVGRGRAEIKAGVPRELAPSRIRTTTTQTIGEQLIVRTTQPTSWPTAVIG